MVIEFEIIPVTLLKSLFFKIKLLTACLLFVVVTLVDNSYAKIIKATSGSSQDLQNAINSASVGDIVEIPAGNFSFTGNVSMPTGITLMGAGEGQTILSRTKSQNGSMLTVNGSNGLAVRISDLTFFGNATSSEGIVNYSQRRTALILSGGCKDFRIHNVTFDSFNGSGVDIQGNARGVIDHCNFLNIYAYGVVVIGDNNASWTRQLELGTDNAVFIEDNYFAGSWWHDVASNSGSRYVFRYNTVEKSIINAPHAVDTHGPTYSRGSRSFEVYNNIIKAQRRYRGINIRGGDGVIFNNTFTGDFGFPINLSQDGAQNCSYPCQDQVRETYIWNNIYNGQPVQPYVENPNLIKLNRDYYVTARPSYTPFTYPHPLVADVESTTLRIAIPDFLTIWQGQSVNTPFTAYYGTQPYRWEFAGGNIPSGLSLSTDGILSGSSSDTEGNYTVTVKVTDANNTSETKDLTITLLSPVFSNDAYFGNAGNWEPNNSDDWSVEDRDGDKRYIITATYFPYVNDKLPVYSLVKNRTYSDFTITIKAKSPNYNQDQNLDFDIIFGYQNPDNYYYMMFNSKPQFSALNLIKNGTRTSLGSADIALVTDDNYHTFKLSRQGRQITVEMDGQTVFSTNDATFGEGQIGIGTFNDPAYFDDIKISSSSSRDSQAPSPPKNVRVTPN